MNEDNESEKRELLWRYSVKWTAVLGILFFVMFTYGYFFRDSPYVRAMFMVYWVFGLLVTLRYFYLWFK